MMISSDLVGADPEGITESSRGPERSADPRNIASKNRILKGCQSRSLFAGIPSGCNVVACPETGGLRYASTPRLLSAIASRWKTLFSALVLAGLLSGCVSPGYDYGSRAITENDLPLRDDKEQIERGRPIPIVDGIGWIVGIPSKVMLLSTRVDNHFVSHGTEQSLQEYLDANKLDRVKVRLNQYAPLDEWRRLRGNKSVAPGWQYTLGTLATLGYTVLPGRILGGDNYNPFTNTINLYSDHPAIALHEAGHAKDFSRRTYKGT